MQNEPNPSDIGAIPDKVISIDVPKEGTESATEWIARRGGKSLISEDVYNKEGTGIIARFEIFILPDGRHVLIQSISGFPKQSARFMNPVQARMVKFLTDKSISLDSAYYLVDFSGFNIKKLEPHMANIHEIRESLSNLRQFKLPVLALVPSWFARKALTASKTFVAISGNKIPISELKNTAELDQIIGGKEAP